MDLFKAEAPQSEEVEEEGYGQDGGDLGKNVY
jgi:hypothetical protein